MSKFENLEQRRALNAFQACSGTIFGGINQGEVVKKLPPLIRENGILGALAFALSKNDKGTGFSNAFDAIRIHLVSIGKIDAKDLAAFRQNLMTCPSLKLRDVTTETMLYLDYLRRFAKKNNTKATDK